MTGCPTGPPAGSTTWPAPTCRSKREAFQRFGSFIEGTYRSDSEFNWRLADAGDRIWDLTWPSAAAHRGTTDWRTPSHEFMHGRSFGQGDPLSVFPTAPTACLRRLVAAHRDQALHRCRPLGRKRSSTRQAFVRSAGWLAVGFAARALARPPATRPDPSPDQTGRSQVATATRRSSTTSSATQPGSVRPVIAGQRIPARPPPSIVVPLTRTLGPAKFGLFAWPLPSSSGSNGPSPHRSPAPAVQLNAETRTGRRWPGPCGVTTWSPGSRPPWRWAWPPAPSPRRCSANPNSAALLRLYALDIPLFTLAVFYKTVLVGTAANRRAVVSVCRHLSARCWYGHFCRRRPHLRG